MAKQKADERTFFSAFVIGLAQGVILLTLAWILHTYGVGGAIIALATLALLMGGIALSYKFWKWRNAKRGVYIAFLPDVYPHDYRGQ